MRRVLRWGGGIEDVVWVVDVYLVSVGSEVNSRYHVIERYIPSVSLEDEFICRIQESYKVSPVTNEHHTATCM